MGLRVIIACGGTGGHLFPGVAVAEELMRRGHEVMALVSEKEVDALALKGHEDIRSATLPSVGWGGLSPVRFFKFGSGFLGSLRKCGKLIRQFEADAVLSMGGFTSAAPVLAGRRGKIKTFLHESNSIPGKANRLTSRWVDVVFLGMEDCARYFKGRDCRVVGTPVRPDLLAKRERAEGLARFKLDEDKKTLLVIGGSQGAHGLNMAVVEALPDFDATKLQIVHLTGRDDQAVVEERFKSGGLTHHVAPFCHEMELAYAVADIVIARSGASTLAELSYFGIPSILVPFPYAAEDHQKKNAEVFSREKAAILLEQEGLSAKNLSKVIQDLLRDPEARRVLSERFSAMGRKDAAERVARIIEECCS